jgi:preprotein translocase subunit YajC
LPFFGYLVSLTVFPLSVMYSLTVLAEVAAPAFPAFRTLAQTPAPAASSSLAAPPVGAPPVNPLDGLAFPLLVLGMIVLFIVAPQMKRTKEQKKLLAELKSGDEIITSGGIHGEVVQVKPDRFVVEIAKGVRIEINRGNVESRVSSTGVSPDAKA